jgi:hypothetical protein
MADAMEIDSPDIPRGTKRKVDEAGLNSQVPRRIKVPLVDVKIEKRVLMSVGAGSRCCQ